jgi:hypothetical protein
MPASMTSQEAGGTMANPVTSNDLSSRSTVRQEARRHGFLPHAHHPGAPTLQSSPSASAEHRA